MRDFYYTAVHGKLTPFAVFGHNPTDSIEASVSFGSVPFVFGEGKIIIGVNYGEFALSERYAAVGIAVADVAIGKYRENYYAFNAYGDRNYEINNSHSINDRSQKTEVRRQTTDNRILRPFGRGAKSKASYY